MFSDVIDQMIGIPRSEWQFPVRSLLDAGVPVSFSSDTPVAEPDWLQGVEAAVLRKSKASGTVRGPAQRISVPEAIRAYTMGGAWQDHMEKRKGSLEPGKLADFCVLDGDILSVEARKRSTVSRTWPRWSAAGGCTKRACRTRRPIPLERPAPHPSHKRGHYVL